MASMNDHYPITGIQDGLDPKTDQLLRKVHLRMEIDDWYQSPQLLHINQRALFFPAFWKFSQMEPHEKLSWFQIAGIHGKPFIAWDEPPQKGATASKGYCTHNSILFCTWHRPYLLLFEQVIYELMQKEIQQYAKEERDDLYEAARTWRLPYWDWAMKKPLPEDPGKRDYNVPLVVLTKDVSIRVPGIIGYRSYPNAFYQFTMPKGIEMGDDSLKNTNLLQDLRITPSAQQYKPDPKLNIYYDVLIRFDKCKATSRHPAESGITQQWEDGFQDNTAIAKDLRDYKWDPVNNDEKDRKNGNLTASLRDAFYRLTTIENFEDFATMRCQYSNTPKDFAFDSAENLHNNMHDWCGGPVTKPGSNFWASQMGHMAHVPLAAFDPIFWVHHSNVDRLISIWQILHEVSWFDGSDPRDKDMGTFAICKNHPDKPQDPLRPFHKNVDGDYWTSADAREVTALGYTYPELEKWKYVKDDGSYDRAKHIGALSKYLNHNYNSAWTAAKKAKLTGDPGESDGVELASMASLTARTKSDSANFEIDDYVVNVIYEKFALGGASYTIHIFVGKVPDQLPYTSQDGSTYVGEVFNFSSEPGSVGSFSSGCENCRKQQNDRARSTGRVILTNALITRFKQQVPHESEGDGPRTLASMKPEDVVPFLKANFHWRVTSMGALVEPERIPSLRVSVAVGKATHYDDRSKLSTFHDYKGAYEITQGRLGGAGPDDGMYPPEDVYHSGT